MALQLTVKKPLGIPHRLAQCHDMHYIALTYIALTYIELTILTYPDMFIDRSFELIENTQNKQKKS